MPEARTDEETTNVRWPAYAPASVVDAASLETLAACPVSVLSDAMDRQNIVARAVRHIAGPPRFGGRALTVLAFPGDNLSVFQALAAASPGDVLVVSSGSEVQSGFALVGEFVAAEAARRGVAAFVVDGSVRDVADLPDKGVSVFARGAEARGPARATQGRIGWPVAVGGVAVMTGDIVVGDGDGVAVVPQAVAADVAAQVRLKLLSEVDTRTRMAAGEPLWQILGVPAYPEDGLPARGR